MENRRWVSLTTRLLPAVAVAMLLTGCFASETVDPPSVEDFEQQEQIVTAGYNAALNMSLETGDPDAQAAGNLAQLAISTMNTGLLYPLLVFETWDETQPSTYTQGGVTFTWTQVGNTWTWRWSSGSQTFAITVTAEPDGWSYVVEIDDVTFTEGVYSADGTSGQATYYDYLGSGEISFVATWDASPETGYLYRYTLEEYNGAAEPDVEMTLDVNAEGTAAAWVLTDNVSPGNSSTGTWKL